MLVLPETVPSNNRRSTCWLQSKNFPKNLHGFNVLLFENMCDGNILKQNTKTTGEADGILPVTAFEAPERSY